ncbi:hypothetical protein PYCC9005_000632 [Savitreella phatthalungensis]
MPPYTLSAAAILTLLTWSADAASVTPPSIDFAALGHVAVAGNFTGISIYQDTRQQSLLATNTSGGLFQQISTGAFFPVGSTDGSISAVCTLNSQTVYVGGNFSRIAGVSAANVAAYSPLTGTFSPLGSGVAGQVNTLFCDNADNLLYIGGSFDMSNSSNAVVWSPSSSRYVPVSFGGFNGAIQTIQQYNSSSIVFGGQFDSIATDSGLASSSENPPQLINLQTSYVTSVNPSSQAGYSNPNNIVCPASNDGSGSTWLAADGQPSAWQSALNFTIRPTKLRLRNTQIDGRGTAEFRFIFSPDNGILNLTYIDAQGQRQYCDARCPLRQGSSTWQEFDMVNVVQMYGFQIAISNYYGAGAGLSGIELYQDDLYAYAVNAYNAPTCANGTFKSTSADTGIWTQQVINHEPGYLAANLTGDSALSSASVTFEPQVSQRGNYSIRLYTPGCLLDNSCATRGRVQLAVYAEPNSAPVTTTIYQTNQYDKYDTVYQGLVAASSTSFRTRVILSPITGQAGTINVVASRVQYLPLGAIGQDGLNGLFQYSPSTFSATSNSSSPTTIAASSLSIDALINTIIVSGSTLYVAGNFSSTSSGAQNVAQIRGSTLSGLGSDAPNAGVVASVLVNNVLYFGGNFTSLVNSTFISAQHLVAYNLSSNSWQAVGGGVDGPVTSIFQYNGSVLGISGTFSRLNGYGNQAAQSANRIAFWDVSSGSWSTSSGALSGQVAGSTSVNSTTYLFGNLRSAFQQGASDVASLVTAQRLSNVPVSVNSGSVYTGAFYNSSRSSLTILGGDFIVNGTSSSTVKRNVAFLNSTGAVSGLTTNPLSDSSVVYSSLVDGTRLWLGGNLTTSSGSQGIIAYDLDTQTLASTQPAGLTAANNVPARVNMILARPNVQQLVVVGSFDSAGSFACPSICILDKSSLTWARPSTGFSGDVATAQWMGSQTLLLGGDLRLNNTRQSLVTFDFSSQTFSAVATSSSGGASILPGAVVAAVADTNSTSRIYAAGNASSPFLVKWDGSHLTDLSNNQLGANTLITSLQIVPLTKSRSSSQGNTTNLPADRALLVFGRLNVTSANKTSGVSCVAATYDGAELTPYLLAGDATSTGLSTTSSGGTVRAFISEQSATFALGRTRKRLSRGVVIAIALCIALFILFLLVALGALLAAFRRRQQGYRPVRSTSPSVSVTKPQPQPLPPQKR